MVVMILYTLGLNPLYKEDAFLLLYEILMDCPPNQFPSYAEKAAEIAPFNEVPILITFLTNSLPTLATAPREKRIKQVIKQLNLRLK
jgi:hypothetical protein